jgi:hypothetical protein
MYKFIYMYILINEVGRREKDIYIYFKYNLLYKVFLINYLQLYHKQI